VPDVLTIGAYGWSEAAFFAALIAARPGVVCDIRRRRGVRGAEYAFVNSTRLQRRLAELGISYAHRLDLAPPQQIRAVQARADARDGVAYRERSRLGEEFITAYTAACLDGFDAAAFIDELGGEGPICLFCVEREPLACHRSLVADRLAAAGASVRHLLP
jgi:uncharacterized protein (DUF488 family)